MEDKLVSVKEAKKILIANDNKLVDDSLESFVSLQNINKIYPNGVHAVYDFNLEINKHDFVALVGPSGCGKSTTLRMIAGLEEISGGELYINKVYSNYLQSKDRNIAMVFQSYALYPQMNVYENIAFGLKMRHLPREEIQERVFKAADILDLGNYLDRKPKELSGGQMQRVALGRAIVRQADLFLMDEPLSNLDAKLRVQMRSEIVRIHKEVGATTIYVTHDQTEAMTMANVIVVMNKGFVQQVGKAMDVYNNPDNLFVATFIGSPAMNIVDAIVNKDGSLSLSNGIKINDVRDNFYKEYQTFHYMKQTELKTMIEDIDNLSKEKIEMMKASQIYKKEDKKPIESPKKNKLLELFNKNSKKAKKADLALEKQNLLNEICEMSNNYSETIEEGPVKVGIRPENIYLANEFRGKRKSPTFKATPTLVEILGNEYIVHVDLFGIDFQVKLTDTQYIEPNKEIELCFDLDKIHIFDINSGLTIKRGN